MGNPFTSTSVSSYNANPPADDGSQVAANVVAWSTIKTKLPDPIKTAFDTSETNTNSAFAKIIGGGGITSTAVNYTVLAADQGKFVKATASAITITTPDATVVGAPFVFAVLNNSGAAITLAGNNPGVQQTVDGQTSSSLPAGCGVLVNTDGTNWFTSGQNYLGNVVEPQGRLTLTSGTPVLASDVAAATSVFYTPYIGNLVPIYNGTQFQTLTFSELTLTMQNTSTYAASAIFDLFVFNNSGTVQIGIGPAWSNSAFGAGARGTGAGTTELQRLLGFFTNKVAITLHNAATSYSVAANQATYVGSIYMDTTNGQVTCHTSFGKSRKWGIWNAYNRVPVTLIAGDGTASWTYASGVIRASNNDSTNQAIVFTGLAEESCSATFDQNGTLVVGAAGTGEMNIGIGLDALAFSGPIADFLVTCASAITVRNPMRARLDFMPTIGIHILFCCENTPVTSTSQTFLGGNSEMQLTVKWRA